MFAETTPIAIERTLTLDILRGRYAAGSRLPTVRELAELHGVTPATIQRVVARLETRGLVSARQGSGLRVNDPATAGDIGLLPLWLEATLHFPPRAAEILGDFLEIRRLVAARLLVRHREALVAAAPALAVSARRLLAAEDLAAVRDADLAFARELLGVTGNVAATSVFNTLARVLTELPVVAEAMYAEPERNATAMAEVLRAVVEGGSDAAARVEAAIATVDALTLVRFAAALAPDAAPSTATTADTANTANTAQRRRA